MKCSITSKKVRVYIIIAISAILVVAGFVGYGIWWYQLPKFHDVTIELGSPLPDVESFMTKYASSKQAQLVTDITEIDLTNAGTQTLTFRQGKKKEKVTFTIQDTTAPKAVLQEVTADANTVLNPNNFVKEIIDYSQVTVEFVRVPVIPEGYGEDDVELILTDASGNATVMQSKIFFCWIRNHFTLELGDTLTKSDLLLDVEKDGALVDQAQIDAINHGGVGTYTVTSTSGDITRECIVTVQDTTPPALKLKKVSLYLGSTATLNSFVESATDVSGKVSLKLETELNFNTVGIQNVVIEAKDVNGNITRGETALVIMTDTAAPGFNGMSNITVNKNQTPDYISGVSAYDAKDGYVSFSYNAGNVNLSKPGTYYVIYSATDKSGNTATYRRKVTVNHDASDTAALVTSIAAGLSNDPEAIRDYVRDSIIYSGAGDWGGDDPVWYGFQTKKGNCYVHALCLQALLTEKGYTTRLIWVTDKTHYWLVIRLNGTWYHIDATPGPTHSKYSLMTDAQRYATLSGRNWDRSAWPKCG